MATKLEKEIIYPVCDEDKEALHNLYDSTLLLDYEHEMDNTFIDEDYGGTCLNLRAQGCNPLGICLDVPYPKFGRNYGIVFSYNGEIYWSHVNNWIVEEWRNKY